MISLREMEDIVDVLKNDSYIQALSYGAFADPFYLEFRNANFSLQNKVTFTYNIVRDASTRYLKYKALKGFEYLVVTRFYINCNFMELTPMLHVNKCKKNNTIKITITCKLPKHTRRKIRDGEQAAYRFSRADGEREGWV